MVSDTAALNCQSSKNKDGKSKERKHHVKRRYSEQDSEPVVKARRKSNPEISYLTPPSEKENTSISALSNASNQASTFGPLFSYSFKSKKKISRAKVKARSEIGLFEWGKHGYHDIYWGTRPGVDKVPRVNYNLTSRQEFIDKFEQPNIPVVIFGLTKLWPAHVHWNIDYLLANYGNQKFKVGEDDDGDNVYLKLKHFFPYSEHEAILDDSPLYVFDSAFSKNLYFKQEAPSSSGPSSRDEKMGLAKVTLLEDFFIPKYFDVDLFSLTGSRRPPHRWLVMGGARSGTHIHVDPLGTSAWNALIKGHKRWAIFPPQTPLSLVDPPRKKGEGEGITWFAKVFPKFLFPARVSSFLTSEQYGNPKLDPTLGQALGMVEVLQRPGETIFVPGGWSHVVVNLDFTIAITQNFCSPTNLEYVYLKTRFSRPKLALKLINQLIALANSSSKDLLPPYNQHPPSFYRNLVERIQSLKYTPALYTSSENSSSSSSSDSDSDS